MHYYSHMALVHLAPPGLYTDPKIIERVRSERECEATRARKVPLSFTAERSKGNDTASRIARKELALAIPALEAFYAPYDEMLQQLVHPAFQWSAATHSVVKRP